MTNTELCIVDGCNGTPVNYGMCRTHLERVKKSGSPDVLPGETPGDTFDLVLQFDGNALFQLRTDQEITRTRLARAAKVSPSSLQKYEHNATVPGINVLMRILHVLGADITDVLDVQPDITAPQN